MQILVDLYKGHAMIAQSTYEHIYEVCGDWINPPAECLSLANNATRRVGHIDVYNVYDVCGTDNLSTSYERSPLDQSPVLRAPNDLFDAIEDPVVCVPTVLSEDYLSSEAVRKAIHVDMVNRTEWTECYTIGNCARSSRTAHTTQQTPATRLSGAPFWYRLSLADFVLSNAGMCLLSLSVLCA